MKNLSSSKKERNIIMRYSLNKIIIIILIFLLCGCNVINRDNEEPSSRYTYLIEMLKEHTSFTKSSDYFDINVEMATIDNGYRYYVIIDKPTLAMYDIEMLAIEPDKNYSNVMAANVGIFDKKEYHMIPNQSNPEEGYVKGLIASGTTESSLITLHVYVQFKNADFTNVHNEFIELTCKYEG